MRIGRWVEGRRASEARHVAARIIEDLADTYAPATINRSLSAIREGCKLAFDRGLTPHHFGESIHRLPENNARFTTLTMAQAKKLADVAGESLRPYIWLSLLMGLRRGELVKLRAEDIGDDSIIVQAGNTKSFRMRAVPIIAPARPWLKRVPLTLSAEGVKSAFRRARIAAGMPDIDFHDLRRSCGSLLVQLGVDIYVVSQILGHSSVAVTQKHYAHLKIDHLRAGLRKLESLHRDLHRKAKKVA